jgi:hypothetical protein
MRTLLLIAALAAAGAAGAQTPLDDATRTDRRRGDRPSRRQRPRSPATSARRRYRGRDGAGGRRAEGALARATGLTDDSAAFRGTGRRATRGSTPCDLLDSDRSHRRRVAKNAVEQRTAYAAIACRATTGTTVAPRSDDAVRPLGVFSRRLPRRDQSDPAAGSAFDSPATAINLYHYNDLSRASGRCAIADSPRATPTRPRRRDRRGGARHQLRRTRSAARRRSTP